MATPTYIPIATTTLTSSASTVSFFGITQDFRDLVLVFEINADATTAFDMTFNGDSSSSYTGVFMQGFGTGYTPQSGTASTTYVAGLAGFSSGSRYLYSFDILDYSATDKHKTLLARTQRTGAGSGSDDVKAVASRWANTSAISTINIDSRINAYPAGTTVSIYGIASEVV